MNWKPHSQAPEKEGVTAIIAVLDPDLLPETDSPLGDDTYLLGDIHVWKNGGWISEDSGDPIPYDRYWWLAEAELLASLAPREAA